MKRTRTTQRKHLILLVVAVGMALLLGVLSAGLVPGLHAIAAVDTFKLNEGGYTNMGGNPGFTNMQYGSSGSYPLAGHVVDGANITTLTDTDLRKADAINGVYKQPGNGYSTMLNSAHVDLAETGREDVTSGGFPKMLKFEDAGHVMAVWWVDIALTPAIAKALATVSVAQNPSSYYIGDTSDQNGGTLNMNYFLIGYSAGEPGYINGVAEWNSTTGGLEKAADGTSGAAMENNQYVSISTVGKYEDATTQTKTCTLSGDFSNVKFLRIGIFMKNEGTMRWVHAPVITAFSATLKDDAFFSLNAPDSGVEVPAYSFGNTNGHLGTSYDFKLFTLNGWKPADMIAAPATSGSTTYINADSPLQGRALNGEGSGVNVAEALDRSEAAATLTSNLRNGSMAMNGQANESVAFMRNLELEQLDATGQRNGAGATEKSYPSMFKRQEGAAENSGKTGWQALYWEDIVLDENSKLMMEISVSQRFSAYAINSPMDVNFFLCAYTAGTPGYINGRSGSAGVEGGGETIVQKYQANAYQHVAGNNCHACDAEHSTAPAATVTLQGDFSDVKFIRVGVYAYGSNVGNAWIHTPYVTDFHVNEDITQEKQQFHLNAPQSGVEQYGESGKTEQTDMQMEKYAIDGKGVVFPDAYQVLEGDDTQGYFVQGMTHLYANDLWKMEVESERATNMAFIQDGGCRVEHTRWTDLDEMGHGVGTMEFPECYKIIGGNQGIKAVYWVDIVLEDYEKVSSGMVDCRYSLSAVKVGGQMARLNFFMIGYSQGKAGAINGGEEEELQEVFQENQYFALEQGEYNTDKGNVPEIQLSHIGTFEKVKFLRIGVYVNMEATENREAYMHCPVVTEFAVAAMRGYAKEAYKGERVA